MADERGEREARARGDINRGALASVCGACVGGALALELVARSRWAALESFARESFAASGTPESSLAALLRAVAGLVLPVGIAAAVGALAIGLWQSGGFLARLGIAEPPERRQPNSALAFVGWLALGLLALDGLRAVFALSVVASPSAIAGGAATLAERVGRALLVCIAALAFVDHLLRAARRRARLTPAGGGRAPAAAVAEPSVEELLAGAERVLYDDDQVVVIGRTGGVEVALTRVRGLLAQALLDAARRRGLPLRASAAGVLEALPLGRALASPASASSAT